MGAARKATLPWMRRTFARRLLLLPLLILASSWRLLPSRAPPAFAALQKFRLQNWQRGRSTLGWYEEARMVAPEGGAEIRGPHPPRPPAFVAEGRVPSTAELQRDRVAEARTEEATAELLTREEATGELRYLALARARVHQEQSLSHVQELVEEASRQASRGGLEAEELGATLRAIATFHRDLPKLKSHLGTIADTLLGRGLDLQATGTTDALWGAAELCKESPMLQGLLPVLVLRLAKTAPQLSPEETMSNLWAIGALRSQLKELKINIAPLVAFLGNKLAQESVEGLPIQVLSDGLWSLAVTRTLPNELLQALTQKIVQQILAKPAGELNAHNTYSMIYAIAMLQETCAHATAKQLLPMLLDAFERTAEQMTPRQVSGCLWALGWLDPGAEISRGTWAKVQNEVAFSISEMKMKELSEALWGLAALGVRDEELLTMAAERFLAIHERVRAPILAKHIARVAWAFAKFRFRHKMFNKALAARLKPGQWVIRFLLPDQLHALMWSVNILIPGSSETKRDLESKVKAFIKMKFRHGLKKKVDRYGDERIHKVSNGRLEPYVQLENMDEIPVELRNAAQLEAARQLGENGPDVPNVRRKVSGRPKWSVAKWVDPEKRFVSLAVKERQKALEAAKREALESGLEEDEEDTVLLRQESLQQEAQGAA